MFLGTNSKETIIEKIKNLMITKGYEIPNTYRPII